MLDIVSLGELLIDLIPKERDMSNYPDYRMNAGGAPANVAVGCSQIGLKSGFIGKVGDDVFGRTLKGTLEKKGVNTENLLLGEESETRIGIVSIEGGKWNQYFYGNPCADELLSPEEIDKELLEGSKVFHFGTISMIEEPSRSATLKALEIAEENGLIISMDPNFRVTLWEDEERPRSMVDEVIDSVDILKLNEEEIEFFFDGNMEETAQELAKDREWVLVTRGENGCYYTDGKNSGYTETYEAQMVDETGAGDAFMSAVIRGYLNNQDLKETTEFANAAAALTIGGYGVIPSLPSWKEVQEFMK